MHDWFLVLMIDIPLIVATEIQNIQVAEDDVCREMDISLHMIFPRLFTSPSVGSTNFKVEFEVNLIVLLEDGYQITGLVVMIFFFSFFFEICCDIALFFDRKIMYSDEERNR